jgi:hypothetical protein
VPPIRTPHDRPMPAPHANLSSTPRIQRQSRSSNDGQWRAFPKVPNLLQNVGSGSDYARIKLRSKTIRRSLNADGASRCYGRSADVLVRSTKHVHRPGCGRDVRAPCQQLRDARRGRCVHDCQAREWGQSPSRISPAPPCLWRHRMPQNSDSGPGRRADDRLREQRRLGPVRGGLLGRDGGAR